LLHPLAALCTFVLRGDQLVPRTCRKTPSAAQFKKIWASRTKRSHNSTQCPRECLNLVSDLWPLDRGGVLLGGRDDITPRRRRGRGAQGDADWIGAIGRGRAPRGSRHPGAEIGGCTGRERVEALQRRPEAGPPDRLFRRHMNTLQTTAFLWESASGIGTSDMHQIALFDMSHKARLEAVSAAEQ
jgi:hypothetical protein